MSNPSVDLILQRSLEDCGNGPVAFEEVFKHFHPRLVRFLSKTLKGTLVDPEDVAQETMVKAWAKRSQYNPKYQFSTWVYTIARSTAADHLRKQRRDLGSDRLAQVAATTSTTEPSIVSAEATEEIWRAAERYLSKRQYSVLWLRYGEEMSIKEVAKTLGMSGVSVRVLLHRARASLKPHLDTWRTEVESQRETRR